MNQQRMSGMLLGSVVLIAVGLAIPETSTAAGIGEALTGGTAKLDVRYRYEWVDQSGIAHKATASTIRGRLGYLTGDYSGFKAFLEMEHTNRLVGGEYTVPGSSPYGPKTTGYPVVGDPLFTELNQSWLEYEAASSTRIRYGRQRVALDNHRFIGNVGWRQNEQTYDALTIRSAASPKLGLFYGYFTNANTVTGTDRRMKSHILNVGYKGLPFGKLTGYGYFLDFAAGAGTDTKTVGIRFTGSSQAGRSRLLYTAEYARQADYKESSGIDLSYHRLEIGGDFGGITSRLGQEKLGGDGTNAFQTPLATLHAMNGWADRFLATPANGLKDTFLSVGGTMAGVRLLGVYHDFSADQGGADYGTELDLRAVKRFGKRYFVGAKYASYDAGTFATDTDKFWLWGQVKF